MWIVTGASGFVGSHVSDALGEEARPLLRKDWTPAGLDRALGGVSGVIHCASVVHKPSTPLSEYQRFNVEGTRELVHAARRAGVRRFVFVSSIKVHGERPPSPIDESTPVAADGGYAQTKVDAERIVLEAEDLRPVVLRLCPVYGRGDKGNVRTMMRSIARRRFFVPGDGGARKSIVHVSTVARVVRAAASSDATGTFVVADGPTPTIRELADAIAKILGRSRPRSIPAPILRGTAALVGRAAGLLGIRTPVSAALIDKAMSDSVCDPSRVRRDLGVPCAVDLDATLRDEADWLRERSLL